MLDNQLEGNGIDLEAVQKDYKLMVEMHALDIIPFDGNQTFLTFIEKLINEVRRLRAEGLKRI